MASVRSAGDARPRQYPPRRPTRQRMVDAAAALLRERSSAGVTVDAVLERSEAPRGSVYHHFPGGRDQIIREAVQSAGQHIAGLIDDADSAEAVIDGFVGFWERVLRRSDYLAGCPVVALTVDSQPDREAEAGLVRDVFTLWQERLGVVFAADGMTPDRARRLSTLVLAAAEGAILLCRAQRSCAPLNDVGEELRALVASARSVRSTSLAGPYGGPVPS